MYRLRSQDDEVFAAFKAQKTAHAAFLQGAEDLREANRSVDAVELERSDSERAVEKSKVTYIRDLEEQCNLFDMLTLSKVREGRGGVREAFNVCPDACGSISALYKIVAETLAKMKSSRNPVA